MSPGFRPRPSLSEHHDLVFASRVDCVAGVQAPAFVERIRGEPWSSPTETGVAGVQAPAFVERKHPAAVDTRGVWVSPGFRPRPSLSGAHQFTVAISPRVSPGFRPRPSLSGQPCRAAFIPPRVSPGFRPRPSLSVEVIRMTEKGGGRVAGVQAPAFVERRQHATTW